MAVEYVRVDGLSAMDILVVFGYTTERIERKSVRRVGKGMLWVSGTVLRA
jgi:hypothetical protein